MGRMIAFTRKKSEKNRFFFKNTLFFSLIALSIVHSAFASPHWGFCAHKRINRLAVFRLPVAMQVFYKRHIDLLTETAVNPDKRRYAVVGEAERHFIDLEVYGDSALARLPRRWQAAVAQMGEDSLRRHGIVPWHVQLAASQLTTAFREKNADRILRMSSDLGHYIADAHVPLHTTRNYNGQLTGQDGVHGFWESRLPELFTENYDLWLGPATYREDIAADIWNAVEASHQAMDSVLRFEKQLSAEMKADQKYSFELRNNVLTRMHSHEFSERYHRLLDGQVERRMRASVQLVSDVWYTCWVNAGQPDLAKLNGATPEAASAERHGWLQRLLKVRSESDD